MESMLIPRTQRWHWLRSQRAELKDDPSVRVWLDSVCDLLLAIRHAPRANFTSEGPLLLNPRIKGDRIDACELGKPSGRNAAGCKLPKQLFPALTRNTHPSSRVHF